jgi:hypothetical protein
MRLTNSTIAFLLILVVVGSFGSSPVSGQTIPVYSFSLNGTSYVVCWYWAVMFNATRGERFSLRWNETGGIPTSLDLYIVAPTSIRGVWSCDAGPVWLYSNSGAFGSANWVAPSGGDYVVLLANNNYYPVSGTLSIMAVNATVTATPMGYAMARQPPPCLGIECVGS